MRQADSVAKTEAIDVSTRAPSPGEKLRALLDQIHGCAFGRRFSADLEEAYTLSRSEYMGRNYMIYACSVSVNIVFAGLLYTEEPKKTGTLWPRAYIVRIFSYAATLLPSHLIWVLIYAEPLLRCVPRVHGPWRGAIEWLRRHPDPPYFLISALVTFVLSFNTLLATPEAL